MDYRLCYAHDLQDLFNSTFCGFPADGVFALQVRLAHRCTRSCLAQPVLASGLSVSKLQACFTINPSCRHSPLSTTSWDRNPQYLTASLPLQHTLLHFQAAPPVMSSYSMALVFALLLVAASQGFAQTALSDWTSGVATNYGGPNDGDSPTTATFGLLDVSTAWLPARLGLHA